MKSIFTFASLLLFSVTSVLSQEGAPDADESRMHEKCAVYAKILLPMKSPPEHRYLVESWIAQKLRKRGATELRAVTGWVRLADKSEDRTDIWDATLDGEHYGCPVDGHVSERTADGRVNVTLSGWAPGSPRIKGNSLPAEIGSRTIAVVDTGRVDGVKSYVALMIAPALETKSAQDGADQPATAQQSKLEGGGEPKPESEGRSQ